MTKKKNIASKLVLVLFVLTLISCCLLGSTFARYVSGGTGSASVGIAKWDVDFTNNVTAGGTAVDFGKLSPSDEENAGSVNRTHETDYVLVATITNNSDVAAEVTVKGGDVSAKLVENIQYDPTGYSSSDNGVTGKGASETQVLGLFSIKLYSTDTNTKPTGTPTEISNPITLDAKEESKDADCVYIWAKVVWTSNDGNGTTTALGDAIDTWVGENVTNILIDVNYTAVQFSELPPT